MTFRHVFVALFTALPLTPAILSYIGLHQETAKEKIIATVLGAIAAIGCFLLTTTMH